MKIGVNDNVVLSRVALNEKGTLEIEFKTFSEGPELDLEEAWGSGSDGMEIDGDTLTVLMFTPSLLNSKDKTPEEPKRILKSFMNLSNQLTHILKAFYTSDEISFAPFAGTGVAANSMSAILENIGNATVADKMYSNICRYFIDMAAPHLEDEDNLFRLFLIRRSKAVHFGSLRKSKLPINPFIESMSIPVEKSKMWTKQVEGTTKFHEPIVVNTVNYVPRFDEYELANGLDDIKVSVPEKKNRDGGEEETTNNLFNAGAGTEGGAAAPSFQVVEE